jgi:hypothetical protein
MLQLIEIAAAAGFKEGKKVKGKVVPVLNKLSTTP